ncbi:glucose 1-dehydrogenase [Planctomicrobium piriforme]|uniref:NAD(P)-dependent dehydrogenase, short-chain alcohol dehydrogenase family n=1 Tax=Planctomicrobium piriforme TaxID=1576369 RepID=A0A1I3LUZ9_9PLAN|nr:glucose 1-dehydrogenase [Planctomicrobium piriforme]SFI88604.1 NAD(P)-dependent dehydrogenase, short-chain alcohol dehydrogenase family [Planctomicrobium piriforme]
MRFQNRTVIVTGGSQGIGAGCVRVFAEAGGNVAIFDIDTVAGQRLADELNAAGPGRVAVFACDVRDTARIAAAIEETVAEFGQLDCLVNNAGVHPPATPIDDTSIDDLEHLFRINFVSTYAAAKYAVPHLRKTSGTIVNMSSMTAVLGQHQSSAYAATKGAQLSLTKALAVELGPQGIRVNAVLPSNVDTPLMRQWAATLPDPASALKRVSELQVFGRMAAPEEIGRVCLFLATEDSSFITGQGIEVEGGASLDY